MPTSPLIAAQGPVEVSVESDGKPVDSIGLVAISVTTSLNKIPSARIVLEDGDVAAQDFPVSDGDDFKPGAEITIKAGYDGGTVEIFRGVVVRHRIRIDGSHGGRLVVDCRDKAYAMSLDRKNATYVDKLDSEVTEALIANYAGLSADVAATTISHDEMVQYHCSDWDYLLSRAKVNSQVVIVKAGTINVAAPVVSGKTAVLEVTYGKDLIEFDACIDGRMAKQLKAGMARIQGKMVFPGNASAEVGTLIDVKGVGNRFDDSVYLTSVEHRIQAGEWVTDAEFGLKADWFIESHDVIAPTASGRVPGISGLHIGVVIKPDADPQSQSRVQVSVPELGDKAEGVWARQSTFYASNKFGAFFLPEVGDEVVLGFMNDDPSHPVILGSLYSAKKPPPYELAAENNIKALVTRSEMKIEFDDEKKIIKVVTPAGNRLILSEEDETVTLEDQNSNKMTMSSVGIDISSPKDIKIRADGDVSIKAMGKIDVEATEDVGISGLNVTAEAQVGLTAKGSASAELSASGQTTVKGAMVMIN